MILILEKGQLRKIILVVLVFGFFIISPCFVSAQAIESETEGDIIIEEEIAIDTLQKQVQDLQTRLDEVKLKTLEIIEQKVLEIKERIVIVVQEVQEKVELDKTARAEALGEEIIPEGPLEPEEEVTKEEVTEELFEEEGEGEEEIVGEEDEEEEEEEEEEEGEEEQSAVPVAGAASGAALDADASADTVAPTSISNLSTSNAAITSIDINWTAPGDDGASVGIATTYDIRYSTSLITSSNWSLATQVTGEPTPLTAGSSQSMTVTGLSWSTTYYFAIKTSDEVPNESGLSNIVSGTTNTPEECSTSVASGSQIYFVRTQNMPQIMRIDIDELSIGLGDTQTVSAQIRDTGGNPITSVSGSILSDNSSTNFTLVLTSGSDTNGTWAGSWSPNDTLCSIYFLTISAMSASGQSSVELAFR